MSTDRLRKIAEAASEPPWRAEATGSVYADQHMPGWVVCDALDNDALDARFIATFDPAVVGALLDVAEAAEMWCGGDRSLLPRRVQAALTRLGEVAV